LKTAFHLIIGHLFAEIGCIEDSAFPTNKKSGWLVLVEKARRTMSVQELSTPVTLTTRSSSPNSVFLAEDIFLSIFFPTQPAPFKTGVIPAVLPVKGLR